MFLDIAGRTMRVLDVGTGPRTLVTHGGFIGTLDLWEQQAAMLSRQGWRVVAYDHRGAGVVRVDPGEITLANQVDDLFAVMDALEIETCVLAGESMGSLVVEQAVVRAPERFSHLVVVAGTARFPNDLSTRSFTAGLRFNYRVTMRMFVAMAVPERENRAVLRRWGRSFLAQARRSAARACAREAFGVDQRDLVRTISVPTLVIHGRKDRIVPAKLGRELAELVPGATLVELDDVGHVPTVTRPQRVADEIVRFAAS
jgi:sigma-B regulation protein RsbQ